MHEFPVGALLLRMYSSAASTASPPMLTLSAPDRKYSDATSRALYVFPSASVKPLMPPPTVSGTNTFSEACFKTSSMGRSPSGKSLRVPLSFHPSERR